MEFNGKTQYKQAPERPQQSWPVKLLMKYGVKSEGQATTIVVVVSVIFIIITIMIYKNLFFPSSNVSEKINPLETTVRSSHPRS